MIGRWLILAAVAAVGLSGGVARADDPEVAPAPRPADPRPGPGEYGASAYGLRLAGPPTLARDGDKVFVDLPFQVRIQGGKGRTFEVELVPLYESKQGVRAFTDRRGSPVRYTATVTPDSDSYVGTFTVRIPAAEALEFSQEWFLKDKVRGMAFRTTVREQGTTEPISRPGVALAPGLTQVLFPVRTDRTNVRF